MHMVEAMQLTYHKNSYWTVDAKQADNIENILVE